MSVQTLLGLPTETRMQILRECLPATIRLRITEVRSQRSGIFPGPTNEIFRLWGPRLRCIRLQYFEVDVEGLKCHTLFLRDLIINRQLYTEMCECLFMFTTWDFGDYSNYADILHLFRSSYIADGEALRYLAHISIRLGPSELLKTHLGDMLNPAWILKSVRVVYLRLELPSRSITERYYQRGVHFGENWYSKVAAQLEALILSGIQVHLLFARRDLPDELLTVVKSRYPQHVVRWVSTGEQQYLGDEGYVLITRA